MSEIIVHKNELNYPSEFKKIAEYVKETKFGSVTIQIEDGRIIQVDKIEKIRFDKRKNS